MTAEGVRHREGSKIRRPSRPASPRPVPSPASQVTRSPPPPTTTAALRPEVLGLLPRPLTTATPRRRLEARCACVVREHMCRACACILLLTNPNQLSLTATALHRPHVYTIPGLRRQPDVHPLPSLRRVP